MPTQRQNEWSQPIGPALPNWICPKAPVRQVIAGRCVRLEPLDPERHGPALHVAFRDDPSAWTYLPYGPFDDGASFTTWLRSEGMGNDPLFFTVIDPATNATIGLASYLRISPENGSIEVGHLNFSRVLRHTAAATEAMYLMMKAAFALGYRRYEWKCDALNAPSRAAAQRLGFSFEGVFRQATVYKGRSRDTAWYSVIDTEWPRLNRVFQTWLDPSNFDERGRQRVALSQLTG